MLDLRKLQTFQVVAETHCVTRAATRLGCSQSGVTSQIQALERDIGAPLFRRHRFSRGVELTEPGKLALEYAGKLLALAAEAYSAVRGGP